MSATTFAGASFEDTFDDGDHADGSPVTWKTFAPPLDRGSMEVQNGDLVLTPVADGRTIAPNYWELDVFAEDRLYHDVDIQVQVRALVDDLSLVGIGALESQSTNGPSGHGVWGFMALDADEQYLRLRYQSESSAGVRLGTIPTELSHITGDVNLRLKIDGREVSFTAWQDGLMEPNTPSLTGTLPALMEDVQGHVSLFAGSRATPVPIAFRNVSVVPEPSANSMGIAMSIAALILLRRPLRRGTQSQHCKRW